MIAVLFHDDGYVMIVITTNLNEAWKALCVVLEQYKVHALPWEWIFILWGDPGSKNWLDFSEHSEKYFR